MTPDQIEDAYQTIKDKAGIRTYFAVKYHLTTHGKKPSFQNRPFLLDIYADQHPRIIIVKSSQCGATDWMLTELFSQASLGKACLYSLPDMSFVSTFVPRRVDRLIERILYYKNNCGIGRKDSDMKAQKTLFGVDCTFTGARTDKGFFEVPIDILLMDELDKCEPDVLDWARSRTNASPDFCYRKIGNPLRPVGGIWDEYLKSDQREWVLTCPHCQEHQSLEWEVHFVEQVNNAWQLKDNAGNAHCRKCSGIIDRLAKGKWIPKNPDETRTRGYRVSSLFGLVEKNAILRLFDEFKDAQGNPHALQVFYNTQLGKPYTSIGQRITDDLLKTCADDFEYKDLPITYIPPVEGDSPPNYVMGIDTGKYYHVHIAELNDATDFRRKKVYVGHVRTKDELIELYTAWNISCCVIDAQGMGYEPVRVLQKELSEISGTVYLCYYNKTANPKDPIIVDDEHIQIRTNKTDILDRSLKQYIDKRVLLPLSWRYIDEGDFVLQMSAPVRKYDEKRQLHVWDEGSTPDHHRHADVYEYLATYVLREFGLVEWGFYASELRDHKSSDETNSDET